MIRAVVFDRGHTRASGEGVISEPANLLGVDEERFAALYAAGREAYDLGETDAAYWTPILESLGHPATPENVARLAELWLAARPWALTGVSEVRFDIVAVDAAARPPEVRHLEAAFTRDG